MSSFASACQQHTRDSAATAQLVNNESAFSSFFGQFAEFLDQYKHPYSKSVFKKNPQKIILEVLKSVLRIVDETKAVNYHPNMVPALEKALTQLFHPENAKKIREAAVSIFFSLMDKLEAKAPNFLNKVAPLVFNFRLLGGLSPQSNFDIPIDQALRINVGDVEKEDLETLLVQIKGFCERLTKYVEQETIVAFLPLFRVMILDVAYPADGAKYGVKGPVPDKLQERILPVMNKILDNGEIFRVIYEMKDPCYQRYFYATARECRSISENASEMRFLEQFFSALYGSSFELVQVTPMKYILEGISVLLTGQALMREKKDERKRLWDLTNMFVVDVVRKFPHQELGDVVDLFVNWRDSKNLPSVLTLILGVLLCHDCEEAKLWDIFKQGPRDVEARSTYWSAMANFASYYAVCLSDRLLQFNLKELQRIIGTAAPMDEWLGSHKGWSVNFKGFTKENKEKYFREHEKDLARSRCTDIFRLAITASELSPAFLSLLLSLNWMECGDEKEQLDLFEVAISFVYPLVKIAHLAPAGLDCDLSFIFDNFFAWLMKACEPSVQHKTIVCRSMDALSVLLRVPGALPFLSDDVMSSWYCALMHHMSSTDSVISKTALSHACKSVIAGFKGCDVLYPSIIERSQNLTGVQLPEMFYKMRAPVELYDMLNEPVRSSAVAVRMMIDAVEGKTADVKREVDICIELLKKFDMLQVFKLRPAILLLSDKLGEENNRIMDCLFALLEKPPVSDTATYEQYALFACSLVVYSAAEDGLRKLESVSRSWRSQSLQYHMLMTAMHFKRYPKFTEGKFTNGYTCFKTTGDHILGLTDQTLVSNFPPGCRVWTYSPETDSTTSIAPADCPEPKSITQKDAAEFDFQSQLCESVEGYVKNMFGSGWEAATPSDFEQLESDPQVSEPVDVPSLTLRNEVSSPGPVSTDFTSSLGFFQPIENKRLFPSYAPLGPYHGKSCLECIHVGISSSTKTSSHFEEFKSGLGFASRSKEDVIVFRGLYSKVIFHTQRSAPFKSVQIVWTEGMELEELMSTYSQETQLRFEISMRPDGKFSVETSLHKSLGEKKIGLKKISVSKKILPMFIIARVHSLVHVIMNGMPNKLLQAGVAIRKITDHNFYDQDDALSCEKSLLNK